MAFQALINRGSSVSLDVHQPDIGNNGGRVHQWDYNGTQNQHWELEEVGGGWIWLKNQASGKSLDVPQPQINYNGARLQQWDYNSTQNQQWQKIDVGDGWFWLKNRASGKALYVHVYDIAKNGAKVQQWDYLSTANQQWKLGGNTGADRFVFGLFDFDTNITAEQVCTLMQRHRVAFSRINSCGNLNTTEKNNLNQAYQRAMRHSVTTKPGINGETTLNGSQIWINFGVLFPQGVTEISQTLIHEMMHCAGYSHPNRTPTDVPLDNGPYYGTPPLRAELCIAGGQSLTATADNELCSQEDGKFTLRRS